MTYVYANNSFTQHYKSFNIYLSNSSSRRIILYRNRNYNNLLLKTHRQDIKRDSTPFLSIGNMSYSYFKTYTYNR